MAFSGNYMCTSFKVELMKAVHNFTTSTGNTFKLALYNNSASFTAATTAYTATNEVSASGSYSAVGGRKPFGLYSGLWRCKNVHQWHVHHHLPDC